MSADDLAREDYSTEAAATEPNAYTRERDALIAEVHESVGPLGNERHVWAKHVLDTRADLGAAQGAAERAANNERGTRLELDRFKRQVRAVAVRIRRDENWCLPGFNGVMDELGLPGLPTAIDVDVELVVTRRVKLRIDDDVDDLLDEDGDINEDLVRAHINENLQQEALEADDERDPVIDEINVVGTDPADD